MDWKIPKVDTYFQKILEQTPEGFELDHLEFALKHVKQFRTALDCGAHIGTWSVAMAKKFQQVIAFEPADDTFFCLMENVKDIDNIRVAHAALGANTGTCAVIDDHTRVGNTGSRMVETRAIPSLRRNSMFTLDGFKIPSVDFIKIDVEGYEVEVLKGALATLRVNHPVLVVECKKFTPQRYGGPEATISFLSKLGYKDVGNVRNDHVFVWG